MGTFRALVDIDLYGYVDEGDENFHEVILYGGESYDVELEADDENAELDLYITDDQDTVLHDDGAADPGAPVGFSAGEDAVFRFYVKATAGSTDYILSISERD